MDNSGAARRFERLSENERTRYRTACQQMVRLAGAYAVPIIYGPPPQIGGKVNGATGCILQLNSGWFVVSASHVLEGYEKRLESEQNLNWQVGHLSPFDPLSRIAWRDRAKDTLLLSLSGDEVREVGSCIVSASTGWPPPVPEIGQLVLVSGFPKALREVGSSDTIGAGAVSAMFRVTTTGEGYFMCQIEREDLVSFSGGPLPAPGTDMGGLSGGPALLVGRISYPLVPNTTWVWSF